MGVDHIFSFGHVQLQSEDVAKVQVEDDKDLSKLVTVEMERNRHI